MANDPFTRDPRITAAMDIGGRASQRTGMGAFRDNPAPDVASPQSPAAPAEPTVKDMFEQIATQTTAPPNLVWALAERMQRSGQDFTAEGLSSDASFIANRIALGDSPEAAVASITNDEGEAAELISRAYDIADENYPTEGEGRSTERRNDNRGITDAALQGVGGFVQGTGMALSGIGGLAGEVETGLDAANPDRYTNTDPSREERMTDVAAGVAESGGQVVMSVGDWITGLGEGIKGRRSDDAIAAEEAMMSAFEGNEVNMDKISLEGAGQAMVGLFGNLAPIIVAGMVGGPGLAMAAGGGQSFDDGKGTGEQIVNEAFASGELQRTPLYQKYIDGGMAPMEARDQVAEDAGSVSGLMAAPIGALGGKITSDIAQRGIGSLASKGIATRVAGTAAIAGLEEGTQEVAEGVAARVGAEQTTGLDVDLSEEALGNFVMGGLAGGPVGLVSEGLGARRPEGEIKSDQNAPPVTPQPAPADGAAPQGSPTWRDLANRARRARGAEETPSPAEGGPPISDAVQGVAQNLGMDAAPVNPEPMAPPMGPIEAAAAAAPPVEPDAPELPSTFPDMKPGLAVDLRAPDGRDISVVFLREEQGEVVVRFEGEEIRIPAKEFDVARGKVATPDAANGMAATPTGTTEDSANVPPVEQQSLSVRMQAGIEARKPQIPRDPPQSSTVAEIDAEIAYVQKLGRENGSGSTPSMLGRIKELRAQRAKMVSGDANPQDIDAEAAMALPDPSEGQIEAGNYRKGHVKWQGFDVSIENAKGSERKGKDQDGKPWSVKMPAHYGYIRGTEGADGDHVDVYMGPNDASDQVFVVDQVSAEDGTFDEHKVILGTDSEGEAVMLYTSAFNDGRGADRLGAVTRMSVDEFKSWINDGDTKLPVGGLIEAQTKDSVAADQADAEADRLDAEAEETTQANDITPSLDQAKAWDAMSEAERRDLMMKMDGTKQGDGTLSKTYSRAASKSWGDLSDGIRSKMVERWNAMDVEPAPEVEPEVVTTLEAVDETDTVKANTNARSLMDSFTLTHTDGSDPFAYVDDLSKTAPAQRYMNRAAKLTSIASRRVAADKFVREMAGNTPDRETGVFLDAEGMPISIIRGNANKPGAGHRLAFPQYLSKAIEAGAVSYGTHNHPSNGGFSFDDYSTMFWGRNFTVTAIGNDNGMHTASVVDDTVAPETLKVAYEAITDALYPTVKEMVRVGDVSMTAGNHLFNDLHALALDAVGLINYNGSSSDLLTEQDTGYDAGQLLQDAIDAARNGLRRAGSVVPESADSERDPRNGSRAETDAAPAEPIGSPEEDTADVDGAGRVPSPSVKPVGKAAQRPFPDFTGQDINAYDDQTSEDGRNSKIKGDFHKAALSLLRETNKILKSNGWTVMPSRDGKDINPVSSNMGGMAGSGEIRLLMQGPDSQRGIYVSISQSSMGGPEKRITMLHRVNQATNPFGSGTNEFADPSGMTPVELAEKLMKMHSRLQPPKSAPQPDQAVAAPTYEFLDQWWTTLMKARSAFNTILPDVSAQTKQYGEAARSDKDGLVRIIDTFLGSIGELDLRSPTARIAAPDADTEASDDFDADFDGALDDMFGKPKRSADEIAKDMQDIVRGLKEDGNQFADATYSRLSPLFDEALVDIQTDVLTRRATFAQMMKPLVANVLSREDVDLLRPYFRRYYDENIAVASEPVASQPEEAAEPDRSEPDLITATFEDAFQSGVAFKNIVAARKLAGIAIGRPVTTDDHKMIEEAIEVALVRTARKIAMTSPSPEEAYDALVELYNSQPILAERSSSSIERQAYSTPAPLAYLASRRAGVADADVVLEPTAGTGMLLIEADPSTVTANELDPARADSLEATFGGAVTVTRDDATEMALPPSINSIIANPPFGTVFDGQTKKSWPMGVTTTKEIDHAIVFRALKNLAPDGSAVLILGGVKKQMTGEDRKVGYQSSAKRAFYKQVYDLYNVVDHFTVDGDLYKRQGAAWPVDVVVIKGKGKSRLPLPMAQAPQVIASWDDLKGKLEDATDQPADLGTTRNEPSDNRSDADVVPPADAGNVPVSQGSTPVADDGTGSGPGRDGGRPDDDGSQTDVQDTGPDGSRVPDQQPDIRSGSPDTQPDVADPAQRVEVSTGDGSANQSDGSGNLSNSTVPARKRLERNNTEVETSLQKQYVPRSNSRFAIGTLVPNNMRTAIQIALDKIEAEHGDIDDFVADALGWSRDQLLGTDDAPGYLSAEQVDAAAMAIYNAERGKGFIIGDQTGVGKGRFVAAMLLYADRKGHVPLFVTIESTNFADMIADLEDIGEVDVLDQIVVTNADLTGENAISIRVGSPDKIRSLPKAKLDKMLRDLAATGKLPEGKRFLFTTYSQLVAKNGVWPLRATALKNAAADLFPVLDESHTAGGSAVNGWAKKRGPDDPPADRAEFFRDLTQAAAGSIFSSATYAKNPTVMSLYGTTDLALTVDDIGDLSAAIEAGGVPLQQVLANKLVEAGQFARRERSYAGIEFVSHVVAVNKSRSEILSKSIGDIFAFDEDFMADIRKNVGSQIAESGSSVMADGAVGGPSVTSTNFASSLHNIVNQMLFSLKVNDVADRAIAAHKAGRKPLIAVANTNEAILMQHLEGEGAILGDTIDLPFKVLLGRYLDRLRMVTVKEIDGTKKPMRLTDEQIGKTAAATFRKMHSEIDALDLGDMSGNPLDQMLDKMRAAGMRVGELTGRQRVLVDGVVTARDASKALKKKTMQAFNGGELDAMLLNKSGSTGFSMHATKKADNDGKPRHMMVMQSDPNIDVFMQMLGRINRTGQTQLPTYELVGTDMAVERRPAAILMRKMASLNANTTASKKGVVSLDNVVDFLNIIGDKVVKEYLSENLEIGQMLNIEATGDDVGSLAQRVTGRLVVLQPDVAEDIYSEIESRYEDAIEELDRLGQNPLEAKTIDLDAKTISTSVLREGQGTGSPLDEDTIVSVMSVKKMGRSMTFDQASAEVAKARGKRTDEQIQSEMSEVFDSRTDAYLQPYKDKVTKAEAGLVEALAFEGATRAQKDDARSLVETTKAGLIERMQAVNRTKEAAVSLMPGTTVTIESPTLNAEAMVVSVEMSRMGKNPSASSTVKVRLAVADAIREVNLPLSKIVGETSDVKLRKIPEGQARIAFDGGQSESREERTIVTGNMIDGFARFEKGQVIMFTDDTGAVKPGIMMPKTFDLKNELEAKPARFKTGAQVAEFLTAVPRGMVISDDKIVAIVRSGSGYVLSVRKKNGKVYYLNKDVRASVGDFGGRSKQTLNATETSSTDLANAVQAWMDQLGAVFIAENHKDEARLITGETMPDMSGKVERGMSEGATGFSESKNRFANVPTSSKGWVTSQSELVKTAVSDVMTDKSAALLSLVPGRALFTELGKNIPSSRIYQRLKEEMDSLRQDWQVRSSETTGEWLKMARKDPDANESLMDLMHSATLSGIDPSQRYDADGRLANAIVEVDRNPPGSGMAMWAQSVIDESAARERDYEKLRERYEALPAGFKTMFSKVAGTYNDLGDAFEEAVVENMRMAAKIALKRAKRTHKAAIQKIADDGLQGGAAVDARAKADASLEKASGRAGWALQARLASLRSQFESNKLKGPYFPLARFGQYYVTLRNAKGEVVSFSRFEKKRDQRAEIKRGEAQPEMKVEHGVLGDGNGLKDKVDPAFVADVQALLGDFDADPLIMDAVWQRWLETLPDQSIRTNQIHRKGREGYTGDAVRAFTSHTFHGAHQLARLKFGLQMADTLDDARDEAKQAKDPERAGFIVGEMEKRHGFIMAPTGAAWATASTSLAFVWYLGMTPAAAVVNLSQTTVVAPAILGAKFRKAGATGALTEIAKASRDYVGGGADSTKSKRVTQQESAAIEEAYRRGAIDKTQAHDLASVAETGVEYSDTREKVMRKVSWFFHQAEKLNREVTFLAAYRLGRQDGMTHEDAIDTGADLTWKAHFDYQNTSRPRIMQNDTMKVLTVFRQFTVNMLYRLAKDLHTMSASEDADARREAKYQLTAITLSMFGHAGIRGVWGYGIVKTLFEMLVPGDDDDLDAWLQETLLVEGEGAGAAGWNFGMGMVLNGAPGQIAGWSLTERMGMPNLWFRENYRKLDADAWYSNMVEELLGPVVGIGAGIARGAKYAAEGDWLRGIETAVPKVIRDTMRAGRYTLDGVTTRRGDNLLEDVSPWQALSQGMGFTPAQIAERYEANNRMMNRQTEITDRRSGIQQGIRDGLIDGDGISDRQIEQMREFNREYPQYPITNDTLRASVRSKVAASNRNEFGIQLNPRLNERIRSEQPPMLYN